jgi:hypothetical protein
MNEVFTDIIFKINERKEKMKAVQELDKKNGDMLLNSYHCGIQNALEMAANIVKEIQEKLNGETVNE